ncbi:MAG: type II toxin-antitoxin system CcdA family antitoxin [Thermoplasmataceae archaeon]
MSHNVSVRLDDEILKEIKDLNLNVSETIRVALTEEIKKRRKEKLKKNLILVNKFLESEDINFYIKAVRESRDER